MMKKIQRIGVLFSGNGSNLESLIQTLHQKYFKKTGSFCQKEGFLIGGLEGGFIEADKEDEESFGVEVVLALSNKANAYGLERARKLGVKTEVLESAKFAKREDFDRELVGILESYSLDLCVLAGFMRILTPIFTRAMKAVNIHPSLLPLFKGANGIRESFESQMKLGGVSVHFVNDELDGGEIIAQGILDKRENESLEDYAIRIHKLEHCLYPLAVLEVLSRVKKDE